METKPKAPKEKRRNNEKRKEKSRDAARSRRSKETEIFADLGSALPIAPDQLAQLDKASVMRLAISFLRVRDMIGLIPVLPVKEKLPKPLKEEPIFLKSLEGFLVVISSEGDFVYLSENVSDYLGITQIDLMGQNVYEYSHPCDHDEIKDILAAKGDPEVPKSFFIRLKCTLTSKGRSVNLKSATFKVIHCTGHIVKDKPADSMDEEDGKGKISSCLVAVGQPIPHPSNIDTPLPRQTFLTKHGLDMKFTHADDEFMLDLLGYTSDDLLGKSVYEYHHAMDSDSVGTAYKCLFSKGQCETNRYRFLAKTGGYVWVVTQATLIYDKMQKPQSVVCVNYVISGVECKDEIYAAHQLAHAKPIISAEPPEIVADDKNNKIIEKVVVDSNNNNKSDIDKPAAAARSSSASQPISVTAKFFGGYAAAAAPPPPPPPPPLPPLKEVQEVVGTRRTTDTIFAPKTEDMSQGFLSLSEEEPGATMLKDDPEDLNCLAPAAGDACIPLDDQLPIYSDMFLDDILLKDNGLGSFLGAEDPSDPYMSYREYRDSSPQLLSPNNMSKSSDCSLPSLCSPNSSSLLDEEMSTFMSLQVEDETDLVMKAPYIPMNLSDDLPLLGDLMWNNENEKNNFSKGGGNSSTLAQMLGTNGIKRNVKCTDRGGGGGGGGGGLIMEDTGTEMFEKNSPVHSSWSTKLSPKLKMDSVGQMDRSPQASSSVTLKRSHHTNNDRTYDDQHHRYQSKRIKSELLPKEKMSSELFHRLISNNHQRGGGGGGGGRPGPTKSDWLRDTGGRAACVSQPSESVLMNLLEKPPSDSPPPSKTLEKMQTEIYLNAPLFTARKRTRPPQLQMKHEREERESRRNLMRKNSLSLLDPEATSLSSLLDLTQQDCEVNAPVNSCSLLQGEELLTALEMAQQLM